MNEFAIISGLIVVGVLLVMSGNVISDFILIQTWTKIEGKVTNSTIEKYYDDSFEYYQTNIYYEYQINSSKQKAVGALHTLQSKEIAQSVADAHPKNKSLTVYVNPNNAKESKIDLELNTPNAITYAILLIAAAVILFIIAVILKII